MPVFRCSDLSGYLFVALMLIPWILVFPGFFSPTGLMGGMQSTSWIYFLQHAGFPLFRSERISLRSAHVDPVDSGVPGLFFTHGSDGRDAEHLVDLLPSACRFSAVQI